MKKCITCDLDVVIEDPFESGRCEKCFGRYMERPWNKGLTVAQYRFEERLARHWYGESCDDFLRKEKNPNTPEERP